jgi:putative FmdB family regulatory protein
MPMLSFQCIACGEKFDELVYSRNRAKLRCPKCEGSKLKQIYEGKCYTAGVDSMKSKGSDLPAGCACSNTSCPYAQGN